MSMYDYGIVQLGSFIVGSTVIFPGSMAFGTGSEPFIGSKLSLLNEFVRKAVTWDWNGTDPRGTVLFSAFEANGSYFGELGITNGSPFLGSNLWSRDLSSIGSKQPNYALEVIFETRIRRF